MDIGKIYDLVDSFQELAQTPTESLTEKTAQSLDKLCQPEAVRVKITFPDGRDNLGSKGEAQKLDMLRRFENKFAGLGIESAQFTFDNRDHYLIAITALTRLSDFSGFISIMLDQQSPLKNIISQVIALYANNITLALALQSYKRPVKLAELMDLAFPRLRHFGVEEMLAYDKNNAAQAYKKGLRGTGVINISDQLILFLKSNYRDVDESHLKNTGSLLPPEFDGKNIAWHDFDLGDKTASVLFAGDFKNPEIIFSKFRNILMDVVRPTGYHDVTEALNQLKQDQEIIIKGERIAAVLETAVAVNHEINNPLTAILGNAQLLLMHGERFDSDTLNKIKVIEKSALRIKSTTQKLMSIIEPITTNYNDNLQMLDIEKSAKPE